MADTDSGRGCDRDGLGCGLSHGSAFCPISSPVSVTALGRLASVGGWTRWLKVPVDGTPQSVETEPEHRHEEADGE